MSTSTLTDNFRFRGRPLSYNAFVQYFFAEFRPSVLTKIYLIFQSLSLTMAFFVTCLCLMLYIENHLVSLLLMCDARLSAANVR